MSILTDDELAAEGWTAANGSLELARAELDQLESRGVADRDYALKLLRRKFGGDGGKLRRREEPAPCSRAISADPENQIATDNLASVERAMSQLLRVPNVERGALMPDACPVGPAEAAIPVGGVVAVRDAIIPSATGSDICCSVAATFFEAKDSDDSSAMLDILMEVTRFGPGGRPENDLVPHPVTSEPVWSNPFLKGLERHAKIHMADQGDGNHFAFLGRFRLGEAEASLLTEAGHGEVVERLKDRDFHVLVTHHGSRGLGAHVFKRGQNAALKHTKKVARGIPDAAAWLDPNTPRGEAYWEALQYLARWTKANHQSIHNRFLDRLGAQAEWSTWNPHNFIWHRHGVYLHGKGATPAWRDDESENPLIGLVPLNMAQPILLTLGADNPEHLGFSPHGAGRNQSRTGVLRDLRRKARRGGESLEAALKRTTAGIDVRWYSGKPDITETPIGYKDPETIIAQIAEFDLASVVGKIEPIGCIMAGKSKGRDDEEELTPKQIRQMQHRADRRRGRQSLRDGDWDNDVE